MGNKNSTKVDDFFINEFCKESVVEIDDLKNVIFGMAILALRNRDIRKNVENGKYLPLPSNISSDELTSQIFYYRDTFLSSSNKTKLRKIKIDDYIVNNITNKIKNVSDFILEFDKLLQDKIDIEI
jgi:hypothetical protein